MTLLQSAANFMPLILGVAFGSLLLIMWRRNMASELPFFFRYVGLYAVGLITLFILCQIEPPVSQYHYYMYWLFSFATTIMTFFVLYEVFVRLLKPYSGVIDLARMLFKWAGCFLLLVAIMAAFATSGSQQDKLTAAMNTLDRSLLVMECGLLMLLVMFEKRLGISWRSYSMVITLGLGICAAVNLTISHLITQFQGYEFPLELFGGSVLFTCIGYWAVLLRLPEPGRRTVLDSPSRLIVQRWNEVLSSTPLTVGGKQLALAEVDSFIPGVEKTVERIMARKMSVN